MGGQTHARRDCASGFSYVNDAVLAILQLLRVPAPDPQPERRVLFVNVDAHHCSGVEEAFFTTDRVCTVSVHRYGVTAFPGSGGIGDIGADAGKHHNINLPVADGLDDEGLASLLHPVLTAAVERFCPHCVVLCAGGSVLSGDRLGCLNVTLSGHRAYFKLLLDLDLPLLVLGGGGYTQLNTARAWTSLTAMACGASLDLDAPLPKGKTPGGLLEGYPADATLAVPVATMEDMNTEAALARIRARALATIEQMPQRAKPERPARRPPPQPAAEAAPVKLEGGAACAASAEAAAPPVAGTVPPAPTGGEAVAAGGGAEAGAASNGGAGAEGAGGATGDVAAAAAPPPADKAAGDAMEVERTAAVAGAEGGGGGGGAVDVSMSEDQMQAQEPGLGDDA